jgi:hypothetical protein
MTPQKPPDKVFIAEHEAINNPDNPGMSASWRNESDHKELESELDILKWHEYTGGAVHSYRHVSVSDCGLESFGEVFRSSLDGFRVTCPVCLDKIKDRRGRKTEPLKPIDGAGID